LSPSTLSCPASSVVPTPCSPCPWVIESYLDRTGELLDQMERALGRLRATLVRGNAQWRAEVQNAAGVLARGVAGLLELLTEQTETTPESHVRARRFATVRVAEIQLYQAAQVQAGRSSADLYGALRPVLDAARAAYTEQFLTPGLTAANGVPDYLHQEIVRALANNDAKLLGPQYPGPLV